VHWPVCKCCRARGAWIGNPCVPRRSAEIQGPVSFLFEMGADHSLSVLFWEERGHVSWARKRAGSERLWPFRMRAGMLCSSCFFGTFGSFVCAGHSARREREARIGRVAAEKISLLRLAHNFWWVTYRRRLILADQVVYGAAAKQRQSGGQTPLRLRHSGPSLWSAGRVGQTRCPSFPACAATLRSVLSGNPRSSDRPKRR
jgi:hypothetical protein